MRATTLLILLSALLVSGCGGWITGEDNSDAIDYQEGQEQAEQAKDPCTQDLLNHVPKEYRRCNDTNSAAGSISTEAPLATAPATTQCPSGCTFHVVGCDIKGNISYSTGERIYHVPDGAFYEKTVIDASRGERWFCTEDEAQANGWRKSER